MTDMEMVAAELAGALDSFAYDLDPYGYRDAVDDREDHIRYLKDSLITGDAPVIRSIRESLREAAEESDEYRGRAEELAERLDRFTDGNRVSVLDRLAGLRADIIPMAGKRKEEIAL